ncbi:hypothetical protein [Rhizobium halophytocola]|uniref:Uncharacterized protein n=1 Tax=Rhizobium halophytocola TaxID=735519 RepID=A0ABS4DYZ5_9HYPH|nr:hypothetical protein [Rhizobium halophytocola]MBP1850864.1 hypothetical protein [Rhizobium halophytocola]
MDTLSANMTSLTTRRRLWWSSVRLADASVFTPAPTHIRPAEKPAQEPVTMDSCVCDKPILYAAQANPLLFAARNTTAGNAAGTGSPISDAAGRIMEILINAMPVATRAVVDHPLLDPDTPAERPQMTRFYCALN